MTRIQQCLILFIFLAVFLLSLIGWHLGDILSLKENNPRQTAFMQLYCGADCRTDWVSLKNISPFLAQAVVMAEDPRFYEHQGVDWKNLEEAWKVNRSDSQIIWGGSSLTQQIAKNLYLNKDKNWLRKGLELVLALKMEFVLSKDRLLEIYLNIAEWGPRSYGIKKASQHYFHKDPDALSPLEASYLAAILPNPQLSAQPEWKVKYQQTASEIFEALFFSHFTDRNHACQSPIDSSTKKLLDTVMAKIFNQFGHEYLTGNLMRKPLIELYPKLTLEEWGALQEVLPEMKKTSILAALMGLSSLRENGMCRE